MKLRELVTLSGALNNILKYGKSLGVGADVIHQRLIAACIAVQGVEKLPFR